MGSADPTETIRYSYGYGLPRRGFTRNDGTENVGFSRLTDGDLDSLLEEQSVSDAAFTGESDALHPQWIMLDLAQMQQVDSIRIAWGEPFAKRYTVQYWTGGRSDSRAYARRLADVSSGGRWKREKGETETLRLMGSPVPVRFVRIWMTESSNTCDADGAGDPRNCVGYAIREIYLGTTSSDGVFHDIFGIRQTRSRRQRIALRSIRGTRLRISASTTQAQMGFDLFYTSGVTRGLPAMIPVAMIYETPENSAAEIAYLKKRNYPISYVEMGEEADGQYMLPEDYAALILAVGNGAAQG